MIIVAYEWAKGRRLFVQDLGEQPEGVKLFVVSGKMEIPDEVHTLEYAAVVGLIPVGAAEEED